MNAIITLLVILFCQPIMSSEYKQNGTVKLPVLHAEIELADCPYYIAGYVSKMLLKKTNKLFGKDIISKEDICVPVVFSLKEIPKEIIHSIQVQMDTMSHSSQRMRALIEFLELKSKNIRRIVVLPVYKLEHDCYFNTTLSALCPNFNISEYSVQLSFNQSNCVKNTIQQLQDKPIHFFYDKSQTQSDIFSFEISNRIFASEINGLTKISAYLKDCLNAREEVLCDLLKQKERIMQAGQDNHDITWQIEDFNKQTVWDVYGIFQYQELYIFNNKNESITIFEAPHFLNHDIEAIIRTGYLRRLRGKNLQNIFNRVCANQCGLKKF